MIKLSDAPYLNIIHRNLPRLLGLFNVDTTHPLHGCGDRRYWAWKLIDFPNGTFQGAAFGLAKLLEADLLPDNLDHGSIQHRIEAMIEIVGQIRDGHGALGEALPNEGSFCVTGLVLADCLGAVQSLGDRISDSRRRTLVNVLEPCAKFLMKQDETHGIISNHLATSALAMVRWGNIVDDNDALDRANMWVDRIKANAHQEGWMREYTGADPGYQSWCSSALAQIFIEAPQLEVRGLLEKSFAFMEAFANPDGSFANSCGSRLTRFYMASGAEICANFMPAAARLANFSRRYADQGTYVNLDSIDEPNLVPFFNDLALAAVHSSEHKCADLPTVLEADFKAAGLLVRGQASQKIILNTRRGGWMSVSSPDKGTQIIPEPAAHNNQGTVLRPVRGTLEEARQTLVITAELEPVQRMLPTPFKFVVLRILSLTVFRSTWLGNIVKQLLAKLLMSENNHTVCSVIREIDLKAATVSDRLSPDGSDAIELFENASGFSPSHMASQGYWQVNDDSAPQTRFKVS